MWNKTSSLILIVLLLISMFLYVPSSYSADLTKQEIKQDIRNTEKPEFFAHGVDSFDRFSPYGPYIHKSRILKAQGTFKAEKIETSEGWWSGTIYIRANGTVEPSDAPVIVEGNKYILTANVSSNYHGIVVERDNITIEGAGHIIEGPGYNYGIYLDSKTNVTIRNLTIQYFDCGIHLYSSSYNIIFGNIVTKNYNAIILDCSSYNQISDNTIKNSEWYGILIFDSSYNTISNNNIQNNSHGIYLDYSSHNTISGNTFTNCGLYVWYSYNNIVEDNTVNGKPLVYLEGISDYTVTNAGQVILVNCDNITVEGQDLSNTTVGVELWSTTNSTISSNNIIENNGDGILLWSSSYNTISENTISNNGWGICLEYSSYNTIVGNTISNNSDDGLYLYKSSNNTISGNTISNNWDGIHLWHSSYNTFSGNTIENNWYGIGSRLFFKQYNSKKYNIKQLAWNKSHVF